MGAAEHEAPGVYCEIRPSYVSIALVGRMPTHELSPRSDLSIVRFRINSNTWPSRSETRIHQASTNMVQRRSTCPRWWARYRLRRIQTILSDHTTTPMPPMSTPSRLSTKQPRLCSPPPFEAHRCRTQFSTQ